MEPDFHGVRAMDARRNLLEKAAAGARTPADLHLRWSGCRDLNPGPQRPERCALTKLRYIPKGRGSLSLAAFGLTSRIGVLGGEALDRASERSGIHGLDQLGVGVTALREEAIRFAVEQ